MTDLGSEVEETQDPSVFEPDLTSYDLGHGPDELKIPPAERLVRQGLAWAARG
jgi:hypothetical protein